MSVLSLAAGIGLLGLVLSDLIVTTIVPSGGAGPITRFVSRAVWGGLLRVKPRRDGHRVLHWAGPLTLMLVILTWLLGLITGWALMFAYEGSVVGESVEGPIPLVGKLYYVGSLVIGRGSTGLSPASDLWQVIEAFAAASGLMLLSLSIAYVLPVVNAVVRKREVASYISSLGGSPADILSRAWDGDGWGELYLHFIALTPMINRVGQEHLTYPILHQFHERDRFTALGPNIVVLDETLSLLDIAVEDAPMERSAVEPCRSALDSFLRTLRGIGVTPAEEPLRPPVLAGYRDAGLPLMDDERIGTALDEAKDRRRLLAGFLARDAWTEQEVMGFDPGRFRDDAERGDDGRDEAA